MVADDDVVVFKVYVWRESMRLPRNGLNTDRRKETKAEMLMMCSVCPTPLPRVNRKPDSKFC